MHLLALQPGAILDGEEAVDLGQTAGDIVILSSNDTDLVCLSRAVAGLGDDFPSVRLANLLALRHPYSVDLHIEAVVAKARFVIVRLLGGRAYWPYGLDEVARTCRERGIPLATLVDERPDGEDSAAASTVDAVTLRRLDRYLREGGEANARNLLRHVADQIGHPVDWREPATILEAGLYWPGVAQPDLASIQARGTPGAPLAAVVFYRALVSSGATAALDSVIEALLARGLNPLPVHVQSLKSPFAVRLLDTLFAAHRPDVVLNATAFSTSAPGQTRNGGVLDRPNAPVLQLVFAGASREAWAASGRGLGSRDLAMNIALPEVDGRIFAGAVAFKAEQRFDPATQCAIIAHEADPEQVAFACDLAHAWADLGRTPPAERRVAMILANYPNRDSRIGNGVGLDTAASAAVAIAVMRDAGYDVSNAPSDGPALMARLRAGPTNNGSGAGGELLSLADYEVFLRELLPPAAREAVAARWGAPETDPFFDQATGGFRLPLHRFGNLVLGVQPARGYNIDPKSSYHDPDLVPPHGYVAFYAWLRRSFGVQAMVHMGKHGNLEWLPGKALALSADCFPKAVAGPTPQLYPFIVNDPGEGCQAKRRIGAVIIDHLTPPLTRAGSYGPLRALETLVDEYYDAAGLDPRRLAGLREEILALAGSQGLDVDARLDLTDTDRALTALDNYLCDLKELQIRDGLHIFGLSPEGRLRTDLLTALVRAPRRLGESGDASLLRALADDLGLGFDPLAAELGQRWTGPRPVALDVVEDQPWRTAGDTVERLEALAASLIEGGRKAAAAWTRTAAVLAVVDAEIAPAVDACGPAEITALLDGLAGRFVPPGPSGAPTRGRPEVLPTGRNFYAVDTRAVPTPAAWRLGWASAQLLIEDHLQRTGDWPRGIALSAWGTANMRTGGDDIAQALALMGTRPTWEGSTGRVIGFEVLPLAMLGRPRVDVTLRISGFFRDAFPDQIDLIASAARAIQTLDEPEDDNPAAARFRLERTEHLAAGADVETAERLAGLRVFGSMPGAYGAGLQALIDEGVWETRGDLAEAFLVWGAFGYGPGIEGAPVRGELERRLSQVEAVVQNQDNREHDLLDSDDYYQFEGGLTAAVAALRGQAPTTYHNDHSRPERPVIRTLEDEIARVLRARLVNPKWIAGVMRHGYRGGAEIAAGVDFLFAFAATTGLVKPHHFDLVEAAFLGDATVREFLEQANPDALRDIAGRLREAIDRNLWRPRSNSVTSRLRQAAAGADARFGAD